MLTSERRNGLDRNGGPHARAETGGPGTGPRPAAPRPTEPSGPIGGARPSHCIHPDLPRGGNVAAHLNRVASERATSRMNSAAAYSKTNVDFSAMAAGGHGDHEPVSVELRRICGRSGTDDCESGRHSEGAHTNANHGSPHTSFYLRGRFAQRARNVLMEQCAEFQAHLAPQRMHALGAHRISVVLSVPRPRCPLPGATFMAPRSSRAGRRAPLQERFDAGRRQRRHSRRFRDQGEPWHDGEILFLAMISQRPLMALSGCSTVQGSAP